MLDAVSSGASVGNLVITRDVVFDGVKVFSATMADARARLGELVTDWLAHHRQYQVTEFVVAQSSDSAFHCVSITIFFRERQADAAPAAVAPRRRREP